MRKVAKFVVPAAVKLPNGCVHTPVPEGYLQWHDWAYRASKTHAAIKCEQCGLWKIWLPKSEARKINKRRLAEVNAFLKSQGLPPVKANEY
jgi:uncharacterized protein YkwD